MSDYFPIWVSPEEQDLELAVAADHGAAFMDAVDPEWFWLVDPDKLEMIDPCRCVMGQHFEYDPDLYGLAEDYEERSEFGFNDWFGWSRRTRGTLTRHWRDAINDRRAEALS